MTLTYRPRARRAVAALAALVWGFFFFGLIDLLVRFVPVDDFYDTYLLETGWGVLYFILVTVPRSAWPSSRRSRRRSRRSPWPGAPLRSLRC